MPSSRLLLVAVMLGAWLTPIASASRIVASNHVGSATLKVSKKGYALVQYAREDGKARNVLFWGAIDAVANADVGGPQAQFKADYSGGWRAFGKARYWRAFRDACRPYDGPPLVDFVAGCKAADGTYWALQQWVRLEAGRGVAPFRKQHTAIELHLSHWSGPLPLLEVWPNWTYGGSLQGFFGRLTYEGRPVYGKRTPSATARDSFGRNVYIDTLNSVYGPGWRRETAITTHKGNGAFCYSFVAQPPPPGYPSSGPRGPGLGERHRITVMGPGVTPIVRWEGPRLGPYDPEKDAQINRIFDRVMAGDRHCAAER